MSKCCEKWDRRGILPLSVLGDDKYGKHFGAVEIRFCPECGNRLRELPLCPYNKTDEEEIIACVLEKEHLDCYKRRLFTRLSKQNNMKGKIVIWKDGTWLYIENGITWEFENDKNWWFTIDLENNLLTPEQNLKKEGLL